MYKIFKKEYPIVTEVDTNKIGHEKNYDHFIELSYDNKPFIVSDINLQLNNMSKGTTIFTEDNILTKKINHIIKKIRNKLKVPKIKPILKFNSNDDVFFTKFYNNKKYLNHLIHEKCDFNNRISCKSIFNTTIHIKGILDRNRLMITILRMDIQSGSLFKGEIENNIICINSQTLLSSSLQLEYEGFTIRNRTFYFKTPFLQIKKMTELEHTNSYNIYFYLKNLTKERLVESLSMIYKFDKKKDIVEYDNFPERLSKNKLFVKKDQVIKCNFINLNGGILEEKTDKIGEIFKKIKFNDSIRIYYKFGLYMNKNIIGKSIKRIDVISSELITPESYAKYLNFIAKSEEDGLFENINNQQKIDKIII
jgi:hypothetical protein